MDTWSFEVSFQVSVFKIGNLCIFLLLLFGICFTIGSNFISGLHFIWQLEHSCVLYILYKTFTSPIYCAHINYITFIVKQFMVRTVYLLKDIFHIGLGILNYCKSCSIWTWLYRWEPVTCFSLSTFWLRWCVWELEQSHLEHTGKCPQEIPEECLN